MVLGFVASSIQEPRKEVELRISFILNTNLGASSFAKVPTCGTAGSQSRGSQKSALLIFQECTFNFFLTPSCLSDGCRMVENGRISRTGGLAWHELKKMIGAW